MDKFETRDFISIVRRSRNTRVKIASTKLTLKVGTDAKGKLRTIETVQVNLSELHLSLRKSKFTKELLTNHRTYKYKTRRISVHRI